MYFIKTKLPLPLKKDIERHRKAEANLRNKINNSEGIYKQTYERLLSVLLDSKAEVTQKIGKLK